MQILLRTSIATGIVFIALVLYMIWFDTNEVIVRILVTLGILFVVQIVTYLVMSDILEDVSNKDKGTMAR